MATKKQNESVAIKSTMVLRPRPTTEEEKVKRSEKIAARGKGSKASLTVQSVRSKENIHAIGSTRVLRPRNLEAKGQMLAKVDEKAKGKMPVEVPEKTDGKKTVAKGKIKTGNSVKSGAAVKRKLVLTDKGNSKVDGSRVKKLKSVINKKEIDKSAATGSTRVLRSDSAKKGDESGKKEDTISNSQRTVQGFKSQEIGTTNKKNQLIKRMKTNIVVTDSVFPPEIIMEILSWLPVEFIGAPMVVCKQWYALIQDRHFIEKHMRRNITYIEAEARQGYEKVDAIDGLILEMDTFTQKFRIRNPDMKQFLELPDPHSGSSGMFFAYTPLTLNYKIVSIYDDVNSIECCEILSVGNDELSWRPLKMPTIDYLNSKRKEVSIILIGDIIYCVRVTASGDDMAAEVVSLDLGTEQFIVTNLPKGQYKSWEKVWPINYKGKLALVNIVGAELCVLVLENYKKQKWGEKESLVPLELMKKLAVEHGTILPCLIDQSERLWFWVEHSNDYIFYDIKTKCICSKYAYWHSLVRLKGMRPE